MTDNPQSQAMIATAQEAMQNNLALTQQFAEADFNAALETINDEMYVLQERMKVLRAERQMIEFLHLLTHPEKALEPWRNVAVNVGARLRRLREAKESPGKPKCSIQGCLMDAFAKGMCADHYSRQHRGKATLPAKSPEEAEKAASPRPNERMRSRCCDAATFEGQRHNAGDRYCAECLLPCVWVSTRMLPSSAADEA